VWPLSSYAYGIYVIVDETLMGNSAATHVATVILTRDITGTAYIFKALHWIKGAVTSCNATSCQV